MSLNRADASHLVQFLMGHNYLRYHLYVTGISNNKECVYARMALKTPGTYLPYVRLFLGSGMRHSLNLKLPNSHTQEECSSSLNQLESITF